MMLQVPQTYPVRAYKKPLGFSKVMLKTDALTTKTSPSHFVVSTSFWSKDPLCSSTELNHFFQSQPSDPQVPFCRQVSVPPWAKSILIYVLRSRFLPWAMLTKLHCLHILFFSKTVKGEECSGNTNQDVKTSIWFCNKMLNRICFFAIKWEWIFNMSKITKISLYNKMLCTILLQ